MYVDASLFALNYFDYVLLILNNLIPVAVWRVPGVNVGVIHHCGRGTNPQNSLPTQTKLATDVDLHRCLVAYFEFLERRNSATHWAPRTIPVLRFN
jgi:hypothetical protein